MLLKSMLTTALPLLMLAGNALAVGCSTHSFTTCEDKIVHWYDPDTGEVCDPLDCGGGRAPPKTDEPGCPGYTGTEVRTTSYLSCFTPSSALATATTTSKSSSAESTSASDMTTKETSVASSTSASSVTGTGSSGSGTTTPATTVAATLSSSGLSSSATSNGTASSSGSAAPAATTNAGDALTGSLMAVAGAAIGAFALL